MRLRTMLNLFNPRVESSPVSVESPVNRDVLEAKKKLRWMISKPTEFMLITPAMAEAMLERNSDEEWKNRPHSEKGLARYVKAMHAGWKRTGEPVIFSLSGNLLNGQHRLMACVKAGVPFWTVVVFGVEDDAFKYMDVGIARTAAHIFAIENVPNANVSAAAARLLYGYMGSVSWKGQAPDVENSLLLGFYEHHQRIQDSLTPARKLYSDLRVPQRWGAFLHYICAAKHREQANDFFDKVATGVGLSSKTSPAYRLRKRLIQNATSTSDKLSESTAAAYFIQAWNAQRSGHAIPSFRWRTAQTPDEAFPRAE